MKVSMFTKEEMHADQAEFHLLVLISKYARDLWHRSLTSHGGEWRVRHVFTINHSTTKMTSSVCVCYPQFKKIIKKMFVFLSWPQWSHLGGGYT